MIRFKTFLEAPRKPKAPVETPWPDEDRIYAELRRLQSTFDDKKVHRELQLFVPKRRDPNVRIEQDRERRYRSAKKEVDDLYTVKEEMAPILTAFHDSPPGDNKPRNAFWTSSAYPRRDGTYSSDWYEFVKERYPHWQTDYGFLFEVKPTAIVFDSEYLDRYYEWAEEAGQLSKKNSEWASTQYGAWKMRGNFPWDSMAKHFDGVHHGGYSSRGHDDFTDGWDIESTAWFKTDNLIYKGAVKLYDGGSRFDNEDED
jgi:hypothetical protein